MTTLMPPPPPAPPAPLAPLTVEKTLVVVAPARMNVNQMLAYLFVGLAAATIVLYIAGRAISVAIDTVVNIGESAISTVTRLVNQILARVDEGSTQFKVVLLGGIALAIGKAIRYRNRVLRAATRQRTNLIQENKSGTQSVSRQITTTRSTTLNRIRNQAQVVARQLGRMGRRLMTVIGPYLPPLLLALALDFIL